MRAAGYTLCCWLLVCSSPLMAQDEQDEDDPFRPGLVATLRDADGVAATRIDPMIALAWSETSPDPRFRGGPLRATWRGRFLTQGPGEYRLHVYLQGKIKIELAGQQVLSGEQADVGWLSTEVLKLEHDYHPLVVQYTGTAQEQRVRLYWSSESFPLEPLPARQLWHAVEQSPPVANGFERGRQLARAQRCAACHHIPGEAQPLVAPALDRLAGHLERDWLLAYLDPHDKSLPEETRQRHPRFETLTAPDAQHIATYLVGAKPAQSPEPIKAGDTVRGKSVLHTVGCLACHRVGEIGTQELFSGGALTRIADKRPAEFFAKWLKQPSDLNRDHRMPVFELSATEQRDLAAHLSSLKSDQPLAPPQVPADFEPVAERGKALLATHRCANCHRLPGVDVAERLPTPTKLICASSNPDLRVPTMPALDKGDTAALTDFLNTAAKLPMAKEPAGEFSLEGATLLVENNCLACHSREGSAGLADKLLALARQDAEYNQLLPSLTPPSLLAVGDKLHDAILLAMMKRMEESHRDYLKVRMPRFKLNQDELEAMLKYFITYDRIPPQPPDPRLRHPHPLAEKELEKAGEKLVTTAGFGCTSCHAIGKQPPVKATLAARGPNLSQVNFRIREPYFYRWCQNPARIVPRMEMPSVQVPVKGILNDNIDQQLAAVWTILNKPGFEPKDVGPLRVLRRSGVPQNNECAVVGTDVLKVPGKTYMKPLVIGLPNRHNVLLDLETARLARWWLGDTMEQRTQGKTWFWQSDAIDLLESGFDTPELTLVRPGSDPTPQRQGQFSTSFDALEHHEQGLIVSYRLHYNDIAPSPGARELFVRQGFDPLPTKPGEPTGFERFLGVTGLPKESRARWRLVSSVRAQQGKLLDQGRTLKLPGIVLQLADDCDAQFEPDGSILTPISRGADAECWLTIRYRSEQSPEISPSTALAPQLATTAEIRAIPGLPAQRLPLNTAIMPTAFAWQSADNIHDRVELPLLIASLEGRVWGAKDTNGDGLEDRALPISDELAAPYGIAFVPGRHLGPHYDVITKFGLLRVFYNERGEVQRTITLADGWGHTDDYHDWAVGLPVVDKHTYLAAIPCQQDGRSAAAAVHRGQTLRITFDDALTGAKPWQPPKFKLEPLATGHRFPMGIARSKAGELFVTDNQGNYNPFNELNHVRPGQDFGFVNAIDKNRTKPPLTPPAVNIPHPWTRSVNGLCFLETPEAIRRQLARDAWGPFENQLIGCEYDTRRLIRLSLQKVGDTYQGACYPFSLEKPQGENFLGPISCAISPQGDLYVGSIRDSGWGGGNNVGEVVKVPYPRDLAAFPAGIAEVRATADGFVITFTQPIAAALARDVKNITLESYTRTSTPAYGGPDEGRRVEKIASLMVADDLRSLTLKLSELRPGYVYEFRLKNITGDAQATFFPAEAHYTLNRVP